MATASDINNDAHYFDRGSAHDDERPTTPRGPAACPATSGRAVGASHSTSKTTLPTGSASDVPAHAEDAHRHRLPHELGDEQHHSW